MSEKDKYKIDGVGSDSDMYARVTDDGIDMTATDRPDLGGIDICGRSVVQMRIKECPANSFLICRDRRAHSRAEVWIPITQSLTVRVSKSQTKLVVSNADFKIKTHDLFSMNIGDNTLCTDMVRVTTSNLLQHVANTCDGSEQMKGDVDRALAEGTDISAECKYEQIDCKNRWVHASTRSSNDSMASWEAYTPIGETEITVDPATVGGPIQAPWNESMILRHAGRVRGDGITQSQDGLYVSRVHIVDEQDVPRTGEAEMVEDSTVGRLEQYADNVGERYR
jgi:hypothetical protein